MLSSFKKSKKVAYEITSLSICVFVCVCPSVFVSSLFFRLTRFMANRDSAVGIGTGYGLDGRRFGVRVPVGPRFFSFPRRPDRLWGPPSLLSNGYQGQFLRGKAAGAWSWPLTCIYCRGQECVDLYNHSPIPLHGVVFNQLSTGPTVPALWGLWDHLSVCVCPHYVLLFYAVCIVWGESRY
jgi:hypothetical protein